MDNVQLRDSILNFSLDGGPHGNQGFSRVLLQLFGYIGHGKSSFINSCKYVMDEGEEFIEHAYTGEICDGGAVTMTRKAYNLTDNITIVDNRCIYTMSRFQRAEIYAQLGNFTPIDEKVQRMENYTDMMKRLEDAKLNPNYSDFIVPILIYSCECLTLHHEPEIMKTFLENCKEMTGIFPIVVVTRRNSGVFNNIKEVFSCMGATDIIPIENYTKEDHEKCEATTEAILKVILKALAYVSACLGEERNPKGEQATRMKFLLEYIHKAELEKEKEQWRREEEERRRVEEEKRTQSCCLS